MGGGRGGELGGGRGGSWEEVGGGQGRGRAGWGSI